MHLVQESTSSWQATFALHAKAPLQNEAARREGFLALRAVVDCISDGAGAQLHIGRAKTPGSTGHG